MESGRAVPEMTRPLVLLAEDDAAVRRSLQLALQAQGFAVRAHASGSTLLADASVDSAICLIADYRMDGLDGTQLLAHLKSGGWRGPAILITAHASNRLHREAAASGYDVVIDKPFRMATLLDAVVRLTASGRA